MMKLSHFLTFLLFTIFYTNAENRAIDPALTGSVKGRVVDASSGEGIAFATIIIKDALNKNITGGITDDDGNFDLDKIPEGKYILEVQFIGYDSYSVTLEISSKNPDHDLGSIALKDVGQSLDEVELRAETSRVEQKIDRKVINIGKDLTAAGATAAEIMNNIQSVSVDQDGNVSLRGNTNVRVLVDGKPINVSAAQLLRQIPSNSIKSIELITNPSAKYNPEGMSGIINIVLNKNANLGLNASVNGGITYGKNARYNGAFDLNYRTGKFNFFANYGYNGGKSENYGEVLRTDNNSTQDFAWDSRNNSHLLKTGFDFYLDEKNTISLFMVRNLYDSEDSGETLVNFPDGTYPDVDQTNATVKDSKTGTYNINYKHDFEKEGHNIEFEGNYSNTDAPESAQFNELNNPANPILNYEDELQNDQDNVIFNLDYVNPLNEKSKLELGLESRLNQLDNTRITTQHEYIYDADGNITGTTPIPESFYEYDRNIHSAYATYSYNLEKISFQAGARLEAYDVTAHLNDTEIFTDDYITIYPSAFFTYKPTEKDQFQVSYSRRVDRPGFSQVNPIREWSTPQITSVGNPALRPQFTNSIELNYTRQLKNGSVTFGTFYRIINDNITRVLYADPYDENKVILTFANTDNNDAFGIELSGNNKFTKWWSLNGSFDLYQQTEKGIVGTEELEVENVTWNLRANNDFTVTEKLKFQLFAMYRGANKNLQFDIEPMWKIDLGARYDVFDGKGSLSLRVSDIFNTMYFGFESTKPYPSSGEFHWESRTAYLGFNYRFGSENAKNRNRKNRNNSEGSGGGFL